MVGADIMTDPRPFRLGEMEVADMPTDMRLVQALAVISEYLHPSLESLKLAQPGRSYESCILCSLVIRDFLFRGGFRNVEFRPVVCVMQAVDKEGAPIHSLGIGNPKGPDPAITGRWDGHAVVIVDGWLIDTTLYQAKRPAWSHLPGMMAVPVNDKPRDLFNLPMLAGITADGPDGIEIDVAWLDQPTNKKWRTAPDANRPHARRRVVGLMLDHFNLKEPADA